MNPTTPASGDELSDERILEIAKFTQSAAPGLYGYVMAITLARAIIAADRAARPATGVPAAGYWLAPMEPDTEMMSAASLHTFSVQWKRARDSWLSRHPSPNGEDREMERAIWCKHCGEGTVPGYCRLRKSREIMPVDCAAIQSDAARAAGGEEQK